MRQPTQRELYLLEQIETLAPMELHGKLMEGTITLAQLDRLATVLPGADRYGGVMAKRPFTRRDATPLRLFAKVNRHLAEKEPDKRLAGLRRQQAREEEELADRLMRPNLKVVGGRESTSAD